jgi:hypothetical protein
VSAECHPILTRGVFSINVISQLQSVGGKKLLRHLAGAAASLGTTSANLSILYNRHPKYRESSLTTLTLDDLPNHRSSTTSPHPPRERVSCGNSSTRTQQRAPLTRASRLLTCPGIPHAVPNGLIPRSYQRRSSPCDTLLANPHCAKMAISLLVEPFDGS